MGKSPYFLSSISIRDYLKIDSKNEREEHLSLFVSIYHFYQERIDGKSKECYFLPVFWRLFVTKSKKGLGMMVKRVTHQKASQFNHSFELRSVIVNWRCRVHHIDKRIDMWERKRSPSSIKIPYKARDIALLATGDQHLPFLNSEWILWTQVFYSIDEWMEACSFWGRFFWI